MDAFGEKLCCYLFWGRQGERGIWQRHDSVGAVLLLIVIAAIVDTFDKGAFGVSLIFIIVFSLTLVAFFLCP